MKLSKGIFILVAIFFFSFSCKPVNIPGSGPSLSFSVVDTDGKPIPQAWISISANEQGFQDLVQEDGHLFHNYSATTDENGVGSVAFPSNRINKNTKVYFFIRAYPEHNSFVADALSNENGVNSFVFKNNKAKTHELEVVLTKRD